MTQNRVCSSCEDNPFFSCPEGEFRVGDCANGVASYSCQLCTVCDKSHYITASCNATIDAVCTPCTSCGPDEFTTKPCQEECVRYLGARHAGRAARGVRRFAAQRSC